MRKEAENLTADIESEEAKNWEYPLMGIKGRREIRKVCLRKDETTYQQTTHPRKRPADCSNRQSRSAPQENRDTDVVEEMTSSMLKENRDTDVVEEMTSSMLKICVQMRAEFYLKFTN